jgi:hypothetical protein
MKANVLKHTEDFNLHLQFSVKTIIQFKINDHKKDIRTTIIIMRYITKLLRKLY